MEEIFDGPREFVDLTILEEWTSSYDVLAR
jgi:hypothetical protein